MKALIIGGQRHGESIDVLDGSAGWVDIRTADTYRIRKLAWGITQLADDGNMRMTGEAYKVYLAVHPTLADMGAQLEQEIVTRLVQMLAMNSFIRSIGVAEDKPPVNIPDTPAELFGPDGKTTG